MELTEQQKALIASGQVVGQAVAVALGPVAMAAYTAAMALLNGVMTKGPAMTIDDFKMAVALDEAAIADDLVAQAEAKAKGQP